MKKKIISSLHSVEKSLHYVWFSWFWSHLKMSKKLFWVVAQLPQRLKNQCCLKFFRTERLRRGQRSEANSALSRKNETKIVKIIHSALSWPPTLYPPPIFVPTANTITNNTTTAAAATTILMTRTYRESWLNVIFP